MYNVCCKIIQLNCIKTLVYIKYCYICISIKKLYFFLDQTNKENYN